MKVKLFEYTRRLNLLVQWLTYWYYTDNKMG